jgi:hypothetical protein
MKKLYKIFALVAAVASMISCDLNKAPKFNDVDSFAALDVTSLAVGENVGSISIPVTIASVEPKAVSVAYSVTAGTAKEGVNYNLKDDSAVLVFDGTERTKYIEIEITELSGEYTGDLDFSVELVSAGDINLGANSKCSVRISDLDHPLASILGDYNATSGYYTGTPCSWQLSLTKDAEDVTVVWIDFPVYFCFQYASWGDYSIYGNVSEDLKTITIPCGQNPGSTSDNQAWYKDESDVFVFGTWENVGGGSVNLISSGVVTMTMTEDGVWTTEDAPAAWLPSGNALTTGMLMTPGTMKWTKK